MVVLITTAFLYSQTYFSTHEECIDLISSECNDILDSSVRIGYVENAPVYDGSQWTAPSSSNVCLWDYRLEECDKSQLSPSGWGHHTIVNTSATCESQGHNMWIGTDNLGVCKEYIRNKHCQKTSEFVTGMCSPWITPFPPFVCIKSESLGFTSLVAQSFAGGELVYTVLLVAAVVFLSYFFQRTPCGKKSNEENGENTAKTDEVMMTSIAMAESQRTHSGKSINNEENGENTEKSEEDVMTTIAMEEIQQTPGESNE